MSKLRNVRGFKDVLFDEYQLHKLIIDTAEGLSQVYGFSSADLPILEYSDVFTSSLGEDSDIVNKEMYTFCDKSGENITLRPEFTGSIRRCFTTNQLWNNLPLRIFTSGPLFRYERPQKGRQRQFNQINFEHIGSYNALSDAQIIKLAHHILSDLNIIDKIVLEINSLGCTDTINNYQDKLCSYFEKYQNDLSVDNQRRLARKNPLRILDSKAPEDQELIQNAPCITSSYTKIACNHFDELKLYLDNYKINYIVNNCLVRGLDYYRDTVFEFKTDLLGAKSTVLAGGRYIVNGVGNNCFGAVGFAAGVERLSMLISQKAKQNRCKVVLIPLEKKYHIKAIEIFGELINISHISVLIESEDKLKASLKNANRLGASYVIFIGENEVESGIYTIKNFNDGTETKSSIVNFYDFFTKY